MIDDGHDAVQEAIRRLPEQIQLDRMFRLKRAVQSHTNRDILPESEWTPVEKVIYCQPVATVSSGKNLELNFLNFDIYAIFIASRLNLCVLLIYLLIIFLTFLS